MQDIVNLLGLSPPPKTVLVVEDFVPALDLLSARLTEAGFTVEAAVGILDADSSRIKLLRPADNPWLNVSSIDIAFLDYYFLGGKMNGGELTRILVSTGHTRVIGISSSATANETMFRYGALWTIQKRELLQLLRS